MKKTLVIVAHPDIARVALRQMMGNERFKSSLNAAQLAWVLQLLRGWWLWCI